MTILIGNAPCSWGVEFAEDNRNPAWTTVLDQCAEAGYRGIELGPVGFMPEDPNVLGPALAKRNLTLIGGVVFRAFHDPEKWDDTLDGAVRTFKALKAHGAKHLVLIDSISEHRAPTAGRPNEAIQMNDAEWAGFVERIRTIARMGTMEYGLTVAIHAHAAGFCDFRPELERLLSEVDDSILKICLDTGHSVYADFDPVDFMKQNMSRISYMHFKDIDSEVKAKTIANRTNFYEACGNGIFCNLGKGAVNFKAVRQLLEEAGFDGWCTVEQDCDPLLQVSPMDDALNNRRFLESIGFV